MDQPGNHILLRGNQPAAADRMRELLARTVQDHVADSRSNAGALEDIRQRMEGLEWLVNELRQRELPSDLSDDWRELAAEDDCRGIGVLEDVAHLVGDIAIVDVDVDLPRLEARDEAFHVGRVIAGVECNLVVGLSAARDQRTREIVGAAVEVAPADLAVGAQ